MAASFPTGASSSSLEALVAETTTYRPLLLRVKAAYDAAARAGAAAAGDRAELRCALAGAPERLAAAAEAARAAAGREAAAAAAALETELLEAEAAAAEVGGCGRGGADHTDKQALCVVWCACDVSNTLAPPTPRRHYIKTKAEEEAGAVQRRTAETQRALTAARARLDALERANAAARAAMLQKSSWRALAAGGGARSSQRRNVGR